MGYKSWDDDRSDKDLLDMDVNDGTIARGKKIRYPFTKLFSLNFLGAGLGAAIGAGIGSIFPGPGTAIGAWVGASIGAGAGTSVFGVYATKRSKGESFWAALATTTGITTIGGMVGGLLGTLVFPGLGTMVGAGIGTVIAFSASSIVCSSIYIASSHRLKDHRYIDGRVRSEGLGFLVAVSIGAGVGAILGTVVFPGIGTGIGAAMGIGITNCLATIVFGIGRMVKPGEFVGVKLGLFNIAMPSAGLGGMVGGILGFLVFPGLGQLAGMGIGAAIGFATPLLIAGVTYLGKYLCTSKPSSYELIGDDGDPVDMGEYAGPSAHKQEAKGGYNFSLLTCGKNRAAIEEEDPDLGNVSCHGCNSFF